MRTMPPRPARQRGLTLVELMVAMVLGLLVVLAATAALTVARRGFTTVDAASQLRDNARFANDLLNRVLVQGGFEDVAYAISTRKAEDGTSPNPAPNIMGFNNALVSASDPAGTQGAAGVNGSDVLVVRYQSGETFPGSNKSDRTMIDCQGRPSAAVPLNRDDRMASVFHVALNNGEPSLMCTTVTTSAGVTSVSAPLPLVQGVESFQVIYGVDGVVAGTAPASTLAAAATPDRYLRADQMTVTADTVGTYANWRRVRSVRIGMVLRAATGSTQDPSAGPDSLYPFGLARSASTGADGTAFSGSGDNFTLPSPRDTRLRQVVTFTVHLRNAQDLSLAMPAPP